MSSDNLTLPFQCPRGWHLAQLKSVSKKIGAGATPTGGQAAYQKARSNFALVRSQNVFDRSLSKAGLAFISDAQAEGLRNAWLEKGDLLLNITGDGVTFGRACQVPESVLPACVNQHVAIIRVDTKQLNPGYLLSFLTHPLVKNYIEGFNAGGSRRAITKGHIESFVVPIPPLPIQDEIAHTLGGIDSRIALLRETNGTLEAIAQALFKSWFVDFDPVRAKLDWRGANRIHDTTAALFPNSFEDSAIGAVPKGWTVSSLGENASYLNRGISPKYLDEGGVLVINQKCIRDFSLDLSKARRHDPTQRRIDGRELAIGDVLVNSTGVGTLGRVAQVLSLDEPMIVDSHVTVVRVGASLTWNYVGLAMMRMQDEIECLGEGSTGQTELSRARLAQIKLVIPPSAILKEFDQIVVPLRDRFASNLKQIKVLSTLRDTLLPRLMTGKLHPPVAITKPDHIKTGT